MGEWTEEITMKTIPHWINGAYQPGGGERSGPVFDPATGEERARVAFASAPEVDRAVSAAASAFPEWRDTSLASRTQILFRFRNLLDEAHEEFVNTATDVGRIEFNTYDRGTSLSASLTAKF